MAEVKHLIMAFQSNIKQEIVYGINILTLFSVNTQAPFLFGQYPYVIQAVNGYLNKIYPPKDIFSLECLRNVTLALRNLLINHKNLQSVLQSDLIEILLRIFEQKIDKQTTRNVVDILSSLTKIGLDYKELFNVVEQYLQRETYEDIETGIDLLKSLVQQSEELCEQIVSHKIDYFARILLYSSIEIRQAILQIFAYLSDKSQIIKKICLGNFKFMDRLFALLSSGGSINEKQAQLSCFILNNISQMHSEQSEKVFKKYERILAFVSFNDESLSPITSSILFHLSGRKNQGLETDKDKEHLAMANMRLNLQRIDIQDSISSGENSQYE